MSDDPSETAAAAPAKSPAPSRSAKADRLEQVIAGWISRHINDSPVSRATEAYNHLLGKLEELKSALLKEL